MLQSLRLHGCPGVRGFIVFSLYPVCPPALSRPLSLVLHGCSLSSGHVTYLENHGATDLDVGVCQNCDTVAEKQSGLLSCGRCGAARCRHYPLLGSVLKGPYCDDTTKCGACGLVLCAGCDDRRHVGLLW